MYTSPGFQTKKALKEAVKNGAKVTLYAPGLGEPKKDGKEYVEGPSYKAHTWYAQVTVENGYIKTVKL